LPNISGRAAALEIRARMFLSEHQQGWSLSEIFFELNTFNIAFNKL